MKEEIKLDKTIDIFKILSDETRLRILILLYQKKLCVCELCGIMGQSQPKISKHLGKLRDMGFVKDERQEQFIFYYISCEDKLFTTILKTIVDNIDEYLILKEDLEKIIYAEKYLACCNTK